MKTREMTIQDRLNLMIAAGHPFFVIGRTVSLPIEAEDFFAPEEMKELETLILSSHLTGGKDMGEIIWNLPSEEYILNRIEELEECLRNFPESKLAPVWRSEIAQLEAYPVYLGRV